jgi:hypothetical protein
MSEADLSDSVHTLNFSKISANVWFLDRNLGKLWARLYDTFFRKPKKSVCVGGGGGRITVWRTVII